MNTQPIDQTIRRFERQQRIAIKRELRRAGVPVPPDALLDLKALHALLKKVEE
jgi:uncharacterized protein (DUF58 family)